MACSADMVSSGDPTEKISAASFAGSSPVISARVERTARSVGVAVGEVRLSVSEMSPAMRSPAMGLGMGMPAFWKHWATMVLVEPTVVLKKWIGV